ncbi:MAG: hypothetical protein I8H71_13995 [Xanthomonadaceae bacterium]|nr:hypothetical protein [Xanthomonadaceae bacterium]
MLNLIWQCRKNSENKRIALIFKAVGIQALQAMTRIPPLTDLPVLRPRDGLPSAGRHAGPGLRMLGAGAVSGCFFFRNDF